jgi:hypothetical protein
MTNLQEKIRQPTPRFIRQYPHYRAKPPAYAALVRENPAPHVLPLMTAPWEGARVFEFASRTLSERRGLRFAIGYVYWPLALTYGAPGMNAGAI